MRIKWAGFKYMIIAMSVIAIILGCWVTFFQARGFEKTTATIVSITEEPGVTSEDDDEHIVTVEYEVNGTKYREILDAYSPTYKVGKTVEIRYNPNDPTVIHGNPMFGIYFIAVGVILLAGTLITIFRSKRAQKDLEENYPRTSYGPSIKGEERELYFLTDRGTAKYGHRIEDRNRNVLYEAKVTKFTLAAPTGFDFIDHEHARTTKHLVGHEETADYDTFFIDNFSTFTFDGEDIWKHLKRNGVRIDAGFIDGKPLWPQYRIYRNDEEIALVESSSLYPHEEDEEKRGKLAKLVPARGYYRIYTAEENLDLLFVALLAFARSSANDGEGGNYGLLFNRKNKK